jgi:hypothetical protein
MPRYQKVAWHHDFPDEPVLLYSEIDDEGFETRKVEIYRDGRYDFADAERSTGSTVLSMTALPSLDEIAAQSEFEPSEIQQDEFERVWDEASAAHA